MAVQQVAVLGMTCEHCERAVVTEVGKIASVTSVEVDLRPGERSIVSITSQEPITPDELAAAIDEAGYRMAEP